MGLLKPRDEYITAWLVNFIDPWSRAPVAKVVMTLRSRSIDISDYVVLTRTLYVRNLAALESIYIDDGRDQLTAMFADKRGHKAMAFDFAVSESDDASEAAARIHRAYLACMASFGRQPVATITTTPPVMNEVPPTSSTEPSSRRVSRKSAARDPGTRARRPPSR